MRTRGGLGVFLTGLACQAAAAQQFQVLGTLPGLGHSVALSVSGDGLVVAGFAASTATANGGTPFVWQTGTGVQPLALPIGLTYLDRIDLSHDGSTIVGAAGYLPSYRSLRWHSGAVQDLTPASANQAIAGGVSGDGTRLVASIDGAPHWWTEADGFLPLPIVGSTFSITCMSSNGLYAGGMSGNAAACWEIPNPPQQLLPTSASSYITGLSGDGSAGSIYQLYFAPWGLTTRGYYWSASSGAMPIGDFGWERTRAFDVSGDGSILVGESVTGPNSGSLRGVPVIWSAALGLRNLETILVQAGANLGTFRLTAARSISADGRIVVGVGRLNNGSGENRAWLAEIPLWARCRANCDGSSTAPVLNVADFTCFLQRFAAGELYANCDHSTVPPVLNVADFTCFLQRFAAGCE